MTLSPAWLDELRARTTLSAVIGPSVKLIKAGREFKVLGTNKLSGMTWSSPAVANGALYVRTVDNLYCIRSPAK